MTYYTIYMKGLHNSTGYIDVALENDELFKDYLAYLDMGMKAHKTYPIADPGKPGGKAGKFAVNLSDISAITVLHPG